MSVPGCRPRPPRRSRSPWDRRGLGCGRPLGRPGTAQRDNAEVGTGVGMPRSPFGLHPPLQSSRLRACHALWSLGCLGRPRLRQRRGECDKRAGSKRCEGESGLGSVIKVVGHWACWTLRWRAPDCPSCYPRDGNKRKSVTNNVMDGLFQGIITGAFQQFSMTHPQSCEACERQKNTKNK